MVGEHFADLLMDNRVIVEIKATKALAEEHDAQLLNYPKATPYEVGLLINFGPKPFDNDRKGSMSWIKKIFNKICVNLASSASNSRRINVR